jgi:undecaprenyl-diphosphatase
MDLIQEVFRAIVLGFVQGITEFLPISSTAHLLVVTKAFDWTDLVGQKWFVDAIQFGSVIAVLLYFWSDLRQILVGGWAAFQAKAWHQEEWKILVGIAIGALPALIGGLLIKKFLPEGTLDSVLIIALASIVMATLLGLAEQVGQRKRDFSSLEIKDGILVGLGQMLALIPGVSRSGSTLTTALFLGLERQTAARFSFLLGLPTLAIATLYESKEAFVHMETLVPLLAGITSAFIFSYAAIAWLIRYLQRHNTWVFVWYRLGFGTLLLLGLANGFFKGTIS